MADSKMEKAEHFNVKAPDGYKLKFDPKGTLTELEAPKIKVDKYREMHIEYSEQLGNARKSLTLETYLTVNELFKFIKKVMGV